MPIDIDVSTHAPREGRDRRPPDGGRFHRRFQPTRPVKGATDFRGWEKGDVQVSTHAPREGRDRCALPTAAPPAPVSTHAPREGRDDHVPWKHLPGQWFQPTRPVKGATPLAAAFCAARNCFNPRAP